MVNINNMDIEQLVKYINSELKKDKTISVNKLCEKIDIKKSTLKNKMMKAEYSYNAELRQYIKNDNTSITKATQEYSQEQQSLEIPKVIQKDNSSINSDKINELISLIEPIKEVIAEYNKSKSFVEVEQIELKPPSVTEVKQKLFKVDIDVLDNWNKFILEHKEYKVQSLISLALQEFIDKYI